MSDGRIDPLGLPLSVLVESSSPDINYTGGWVSVAPTGDLLDLNRYDEYAFSDALYKAPVGQSSISYTFTGTNRLQVRGTLVNPASKPASYDTSCNVSPRGPTVATEQFSSEGEEKNNYIFCEIRNLSPTTTYTLTFGVDVTSGSPVLFDRLVMVPTDTTNLESALVNVDHRNSLIQYDSSWEDASGTAHLPTAASAKATISFTGTSAKLYGRWHSIWANGASDASYSIDGGAPRSFVIPAIDPAYSNRFIEDLLFETPELTADSHTLEVIAPSTTTARPLAIGNFVVQNAPAADSLVARSFEAVEIPSISTVKSNPCLATGACAAMAGMVLFALFGVAMYRRGKKAGRAQRLSEEARYAPSMAFDEKMASA